MAAGGVSSTMGPAHPPAPAAAPRAASAPPLARPGIYLVRMAVFLALVGFLAFILFRQIRPAFLANPGLNGLILGVLLVAVLVAVGQVLRLYREVRFVNRAARGEAEAARPRLLAPLAPLVAARAREAGPPDAAFRPLLDTLALRLDEGREILRYIAGILILLGLLGTFWGLIDTLSAVGRVISGMRGGGGDAAVMFDELKNGLAVPLSGIGLAFSASLFGLAGSLVTGFLDLQAGQAHARFQNDLEDWFVAGAGPEAVSGVPGSGDPALADAVAKLSAAVTEGGGRAATQAMANLAEGIQGLVQHMRAEQQMIRDWVEAQAARERELKQVLDRLARERVG
jgi:biopolymer transport protein ExbB/TolQ